MNELTNHEKVANIVSFFTILLGEETACFKEIMKLHPDYIIEKFAQYIVSTRKEYQWGMHPSLRNHHFQRYIDAWELELKDE
jgi:hypothetical protein